MAVTESNIESIDRRVGAAQPCRGAAQRDGRVVAVHPDKVGRLDRRLQVVAQRRQPGVVCGRCRGQCDQRGGQRVAQVHRQTEADSAAELAVGQRREARRHDLLGPGRRLHRQVARGAEGDAAVFLPGAQVDRAADHDAVGGPGVGQTGRATALAAADVDSLACQQVAAEADLAAGVNHDLGITAKRAHRRAQRLPCGARRILGLDHLAAGNELAEQLRVLPAVDRDHAVGVRHGEQGRARHRHAERIAADTAEKGDVLARPQRRTDRDRCARLVQRRATERNLAGGLDQHARGFAGPGDGPTAVDAAA